MLLTIIAACAVVGVGVWVLSWWQSRQAIEQVTSGLGGSSANDLTGRWTRESDADDDREADLIIDDDDPIEGTITVTFEESGVTCTATWTESTRDFGTIYVDAKVTSGDCVDNEWAVTVTGNTMTARQNWSAAGGNTSTPDLVLHKQT